MNGVYFWNLVFFLGYFVIGCIVGKSFCFDKDVMRSICCVWNDFVSYVNFLEFSFWFIKYLKLG